MKLEYLNGVRITKHYHEMTPLEAAINRYENLAKNYYQNDKLEMTKDQRDEAKTKAEEHLESERRRLKTISRIQTQLEEYRKQGELALSKTPDEAKKAVQMMEAEKHHPTSILEKYMRAEGKPKPSPDHTAHHILPGEGQYRQQAIADARLHMHLLGIRINDPANGVYLVTVDKNTPHWSMPESRGHLKYHTAVYEQYVSERVQMQFDMDHLKTQLQVIGRILQENEPKTSFKKIRGL